MKGWYNHMYIVLLLISNAVAILQLIIAFKWPRVAKCSFFLLFGWACWINWKTILQTPEVYLEYADLAWSGRYSNFINGWFASHAKICVGFIATCQGIIALLMFLREWWFKMGCMGGIIFLVAILPLGVGSGFPATAIMALSLLVLLRKDHDRLIWEKPKALKNQGAMQHAGNYN